MGRVYDFPSPADRAAQSSRRANRLLPKTTEKVYNGSIRSSRNKEKAMDADKYYEILNQKANDAECRHQENLAAMREYNAQMEERTNQRIDRMDKRMDSFKADLMASINEVKVEVREGKKETIENRKWAIGLLVASILSIIGLIINFAK